MFDHNPVVSTMRKRASFRIILSKASAARSSGMISMVGRTPLSALKASVSWESMDDIPAKLFRISAKDGKAGSVTELKSSRPLDHADAMRSFGHGFLLIEGNGKLDKVTIQGDEANVETIKDGLVEPVSVTQVGDIGWVAEGKLSYIIGDNKGKDPGPFALKPVALPR